MSLLAQGELVDIPGVQVVSPSSHGGPLFCRLSTEDYRMRASLYVHQIILHTTGGLWPQPVLSGAGRSGHAREILDMWAGRDRGDGDKVHSAAQIVVDFDGVVYCAADVIYHEAYHAEGSNPFSVGIEMCTTPRGEIYQATLQATARLVGALTWAQGPGILPIPFQGPRGPYPNRPLRRMEVGSSAGGDRRQLGGASLVGVFGHRDNTEQRGAGDPGNAVWDELRRMGLEEVDYDHGEDLIAGRARQKTLNSRGAKLSVDGVVGPASLAAAHAAGFSRWRDVC